MKDLPIRILVAAALLGLLALVLFFGGWVQAAVLGLFCCLSVFEMRSVFRAKELDPFVIPQAVLGAALFILMYLLGNGWVLAAFMLAFLAVAIERIFNKKRTNDDVLASLVILLYPILPFAFLGLVGFETGAASLSRLALLCIFAGVCMADNGAYLVGSLMGKHKLCPVISPNKTVEGAIGGLVGGALGGVIAYFAQFIWTGSRIIPMPAVIVICFLAGLVGQFGDLFASTFKRWAGIKDFSHIFPGHGGIIDRLDSALFAAPLVYFAIRLIESGALGFLGL